MQSNSKMMLKLELFGSLPFERVTLRFEEGEHKDVFVRKNNRTVEQTIEQQRYRRLEAETRKLYRDSLTKPLGQFLYERKCANDPFYRRFLNGYGDASFCTFSLGDPARYQQKGLYAFVLDETKVVYVGRCLDSFRNRINQGYGRIYPKNCYLDGQATNCHLNSLIREHRARLSFYVCPMSDEDDIKLLEKELIRADDPKWNKALKKRRPSNRTTKSK